MIKRFLPRSLLGRSLLIIVAPVVLLQLVSATIFYESHWDKVSLRLARNLAGDVAAITELIRNEPSAEKRDQLMHTTAGVMGLEVEFRPAEILANTNREISGGRVERTLARTLSETIKRPIIVDSEAIEDHILINVQLPDGILRVVANRKRLFSSTTYVFVMWTVGMAMILFGVAIIFMRNQVRPIRRLASAADDFGKGRDAPNFKPEGATEVRRAAAAFIAMRDRIQRQIMQRTDMLAGVSHDLRTPLTRMKLQLEMLGKSSEAADLKQDVAEMEHMLEGYLAFARGEGDETPIMADLSDLVAEVVGQARRKGAAVDLHCEGSISVPVRPNAIKRCITNLVENASRYGEHVSVRIGQRDDVVEIIIDDDGPGIAEDKREEAFRPFYRLDDSRNQGTGGVGLGLSIARDVVRGHGGDIVLSASPAGGLRAKVTLPL